MHVIHPQTNKNTRTYHPTHAGRSSATLGYKEAALQAEGCAQRPAEVMTQRGGGGGRGTYLRWRRTERPAEVMTHGSPAVTQAVLEKSRPLAAKHCGADHAVPPMFRMRWDGTSVGACASSSHPTCAPTGHGHMRKCGVQRGCMSRSAQSSTRSRGGSSRCRFATKPLLAKLVGKAPLCVLRAAHWFRTTEPFACGAHARAAPWVPRVSPVRPGQAEDP